jgi:hypothetical protein
MQYTLDVLRPRLPLISLNVIEVFFYWNVDGFNVMFVQQLAYCVRCEVLVQKPGNSCRLFRGCQWLVPGVLIILSVSPAIAFVFEGLL